MRTEFIRRIT